MLLISNGTLVNPKTNQFENLDVLIKGDRIIEVKKNIPRLDTYDVINARGLYIVPGFIDLHVHLREPGFEEKETIYSGSRACAKGGYTSVVCMPNTKPALDSRETIERLKEIIKKDSVISIFPAGAITKNIAGEVLTDHNELFRSGAITLSDDGRTTMNKNFMKEAFKVSRIWNKPIMTHSEDHEVTIHYKDDIFPTVAESSIVSRDILICEQENGILHVSHVSTSEAIKEIERAKARGVEVTCEAAPHHFALSNDRVDMTSAYSKVNPPIRSEEDRKNLVAAIKKGVIDVIATDHAPHEKKSKEKSFAEASFGISGIESAFAVSYKALVETNEIPLMHLIKLMTENPAKIARFNDVGSIEVGYLADIVLLDLEADVVIDSEKFISKGKNTPFNGYVGKGEVELTLFHGIIIYQKNNNEVK